MGRDGGYQTTLYDVAVAKHIAAAPPRISGIGINQRGDRHQAKDVASDASLRR